MKTFFSVLLFSLSTLAFAADAPQPEQQPSAIQEQCAIDQAQLATLTEEARRAVLERRGCCSWHGGVCGCGGSRAQCCDGTLSPSCGC
jgi:opacity protein-like surface antigen